MKYIKYAIVGQGLAGSALSYRLMKRGIAHIVIDTPYLSASSRIAAGLINPIVLKRLSLVADAELFQAETTTYYSELEQRLGIRFYHHLALKHIFHDTSEVNHWQEKMGDDRFSKHLGEPQKNTYEKISASEGLGEVISASWLNTQVYLKSYRELLVQKDMLYELEITNLTESFLSHKNYKIENFIICNGHLLRKLIPETNLFFRPTKGEVLTIHSDELPEDMILHKKMFILPLGNQLFKVGSTYHWKELNEQAGTQAREELIANLEKMFTGNYKVVAHEAGIRPNIKDRKPVLGRYKNYYIFNGLGSRGALMAPYLSKIMSDFILEEKPIPPKWNIDRFI